MVKCLWGLPEGACTWFLSTWATLATFSTATWATSAAFSTASQTASATTRTVVAFYTTNRPSSLAISSSWRSCKYYCACTNMLELSNMVNKVKAAGSWRICALRKLVAAISAVAWAWALMVHFLCFSNFYSIYAIWELQGHDGLLPPLLRKSPSPWASTSGSSLSSVMTTAKGGGISSTWASVLLQSWLAIKLYTPPTSLPNGACPSIWANSGGTQKSVVLHVLAYTIATLA